MPLLHSNLIPPKDGTNGLLCLVAYISQTGCQCFPACFCDPSVGKFDLSPYYLTISSWRDSIRGKLR